MDYFIGTRNNKRIKSVSFIYSMKLIASSWDIGGISGVWSNNRLQTDLISPYKKNNINRRLTPFGKKVTQTLNDSWQLKKKIFFVSMLVDMVMWSVFKKY